MTEAKIGRFFKEYVQPRWQPSVLPLTGDVNTKLVEALTTIGRRLMGDGFVLDDANLPIYLKAVRLITGNEGALPLTKGLYVWGKVGCGKTTMLRVVGLFAQIYNKRNGYRIEHCHDASHAFQLKGAEALEEFTTGSVCFDELGSEPRLTSYYGTQVAVLPMHIDKRYRLWSSQGRWTHFTSNFDLKWVAENYGVREADRIKEMCSVLQMPGSSRRR